MFTQSFLNKLLSFTKSARVVLVVVAVLGATIATATVPSLNSSTSSMRPGPHADND